MHLTACKENKKIYIYIYNYGESVYELNFHRKLYYSFLIDLHANKVPF
jgi:hypothetical protein